MTDASALDPTGGLRITPRAGVAGWSVDELVRPGLRRNPRRAHLWVSTVLGKHIPVAPSRIIGAAEALADHVATVVDAHGPMTVFGFAETATGLGHCVARRLHAQVHLQSTRRAVPAVPTTARFVEGHSHATDHLVQPTSRDLIPPSVPCVLVDDEISTGATAIAAIAALQPTVRASSWVVAALVDLRTETDRERCAAMAREAGVAVDFVALATGSAVVPPDLVDRVAALPDPLAPDTTGPAGTVTRTCIDWPAEVPDSGRHGMLASETAAFDDALVPVVDAIAERLDPRRPVLVLGHEEFMYLPLRIGAALEDRGRSVTSQTTTRSPAYVSTHSGYPLRSGFAFTAPEPESAAGVHGTRHLYNAAADDPATQRVLVVDPPADTAALAAPGGVADVLTAGGRDLLVVVAGGTSFDALARARVDSGRVSA
ncbi:phosphoribosyltransferase family protein [uncultured Williamsia sp.]|uniref:phosphoribosyltransferase family protein n=1 Tax=uncultured Williamsia sp. TaxID=259311 RepID=UPI00262B30A9|nr:phosphoribosyltransferase family protein [uncultured Williamsia sp.]